MNTVPLGKVADVAMGSAPPGQSYNDKGKGLPMIAGAGDYGEKYPDPKKWTTSPSRVTEIGDLIVCVRATIGNLNWADKKYCLGRGVAGLRAKKAKLDINFAAHYINAKKNDLAKLGTGSTFLAIRRADLENFPIPLLPLPEQKRIAAILDKADSIRRKRQAAIQLADDFLRATFLDMFGDPVTNPKGWKVKPLEKLVDFRTGKIDSNAAVEGGRYPFFTCSRKNFKIDTYAFDCEALLLAGNNAAAEYSVKYYKGKFNAYQRTYVITILEDQLTYRYLQIALEMKLQDLKRLSKGTNTKYLTLGILNNIMIQVPDKQASNSFERIFNKIDRCKAKQEKGSRMSEMNVNSLTQRAFRGELQEPQHNYRTPQIRQKMKKRQLEHRLANLSRKKLLEHRQVYNNFLGPRKKLTISQTLYDTYACENEYVFDAVSQFTKHTLAMLNPKIFSQEKTTGFPIEYRLFWHLFNTAIKYSRYYTGISGEVDKHPEIAYYTNPPISRLAAVTLSQLKNNFQLCAQLAYSLSEESFLNYQARLEEHTNLSAQAIKKTWIDSFNGAIDELDPGKPLLDLEALQEILCYANLSGEFKEYDGLIAVRGIADNWLTESFYQTAGATELLILSKHLVEIKM